MGKICFTRLTWIDFENIMFENEKKRKRPARLKTRKGGLGKSYCKVVIYNYVFCWL